MIVFFIFVHNKNGDNMKTILFTGARSGIINKVIDKIINDYYIYLTVETEMQLKCVKEKYKNYENVNCFKLDVTNKSDIEKIKNLDIDIFVSNSAIGMGGSISEMPMEKVRKNYEVNVFSNFELTQIILKNMVLKNKGKVIIISSLAGVVPLPFLGSYCSTKSSISMLTMCLRKELSLISDNIKIKMIQPGFYHTGFNDVMFDNKNDLMSIDSFFSNILDEINKKEGKMIRLLEKKKYDSIVKKIILAIKKDDNRFIYRAPFFQNVFARLYGLIRW